MNEPMNNDHSTIGSNHNPTDATTVPMSSDRAKENGFVGRARATAGALPSKIDEQIKRNPYVTIGVAAALGTGFGIVFSSRVLRTVLAAVGAAAAAELTRAYFRKNAWVVKAS
jgi:hypothetical protein